MSKSSKFTDLFIHRPVLAIVVSLLILILGILSFRQLSVRQYPLSENAVITVTTAYVGADAELIQGFITTPLEREIASADGIDYMQSSSSQGVSSISAYLRLNFDGNVAMTQISAKVDKVRNQLPAGSEVPGISLSTGDGPDALYVGFNSDTMARNQITDYIAREVLPRIESIAGVARAETRGARNFAMRIWLDPERMAALGITPAQVRQALTANNYQAAIGQTRGAVVSVNLSTDTDLHSAREFRELIVRQQAGSVVRVKDIARVSLDSETYDSAVILSGEDSIMLGISVLPGANVLDVIENVRRVFPEVVAQLPPGLTAKIVFDRTGYIEEAIAEVKVTLVEALLIVTLVIFLFMGSLRLLLIPVVTIPLSLVGAGIFMLALGYSINLLTLLALVIAIGLVVDDAIIVAENIHRHVESGQPVLEAALQGAGELATPVIAMTITLVAVYLPIGFMGGLTGSLFSEFAFTLAGAVLISGVVALTLSPMMCAYLVQPQTSRGSRLVALLDRTFEAFRSRYQSLLHGVLNFVPVVVAFAALVLGSIYFMFVSAPRELLPLEDEGKVFVQSIAPANTSPDQLENYVRALGERFLPIDGVERLFQFTGAGGGRGSSNSAFTGVIFKARDERKYSQAELHQQLQQAVSEIPGMKSIVFEPPPISTGSMGATLQMVIGATAPAEEIYAVANSFMERLRESGKFAYLDLDLKFDLPQVKVRVDRDKAADLGIDMQQLGTDMAFMLGGNYVNRFSIGGRSYKVIPQVDRRFGLNPEQLAKFKVATASGKLVPVSSVVSFDSVVTPQSLNHFEQLNATTLSAAPMPGISMGDAIAYIESVAAQTLPRGYRTDYTGGSRQFVQEGNSLTGAFFIAIVLIFLVLAAQFESFRDPLIMLVSVPMSIAGALLFVWAGYATINIYTQIGLITLIGLVSKHGILIVQFANQLQQQLGISKREAVEQAAGVRLRPILMTTAAMVLGVLPLLLARGAGAMARFDIGLVIAAGMSIGTLFTLFVVPTFYVLLAKDHSMRVADAMPPPAKVAL